MGSRFSRGAGGYTVVAQPTSELLPGLDRPTAVLWLGLGLVAINDIFEHGTLFSVIAGSFGHSLDGSFSPLSTLFELGLVGALYVFARISDDAGSIAILLLIALWVVWGVLHVNRLNPKGAGSTQGSSDPSPTH